MVFDTSNGILNIFSASLCARHSLSCHMKLNQRLVSQLGSRSPILSKEMSGTSSSALDHHVFLDDSDPCYSFHPMTLLSQGPNSMVPDPQAQYPPAYSDGVAKSQSSFTKL